MTKFEKTQAKSIGDILVDTNYEKILVPQFQRDYSWDATTGNHQISDLWDDLNEKFFEYLEDNSFNPDYLIGPMVFIQNKNEKTLEIVDGQQRLATLTMMFCVIRDIYHNLACDISQYDFGDAKLQPIYDLIENLRENNDGETKSHINWRLELNNKDKEKFVEYVQRYKQKDLGEEIAQPGDKFLKVTDKIKFLKSKLNDTENSLEPSHKKIINCYVFLYEQFTNALATKFGLAVDNDSILNQLVEDTEKEIDEKIRSDPEMYGLPREFFTADKDGLDTFTNESWNDDEKKEIKLEYDVYYNKNKNKKTLKTFEDWKKNKIKKIADKQFPNGSCYSSIRTEMIDDVIVKKKNELGQNNKFILLNFAKFLIQKRLFSVRIIVDDEEDAYEIFETVNGRGEPLSKSSMIKNFLLKQIPDKSEKTTYSQKWDNMVKSLFDNSNKKPDVFLRESLLSRGSKDDENSKFVFQKFPIKVQGKKWVKVTKDNLYKVIKYDYEIRSEDERSVFAKHYIDEILLPDSVLSNFLDDPLSNWPKKDKASKLFHGLRPAMIDLMNLDAVYIRLPIMCAYRKWGRDSIEFNVLVKFLVPFFFRYKTICDKNTTRLESMMLKVCERIQNGKDPHDDVVVIIKYLLQYNVDDETFKHDFVPRLEDPDTDLAKFVLQHISTQLGSPFPDVEAIEDLHVEHILPKKPLVDSDKIEENWVETEFTKGYDNDVHKSLARFDHWNKKLGNLTLLKDKINSSIKNKNFKTKKNYVDKKTNEKKGYQSSQLEINKKTVMKIEWTDTSRMDWTVVSIHNRENYFAELALDIWELPKTVCSNHECINSNGILLSNLEMEPLQKNSPSIGEYKCPKCNSEIKLDFPKNQVGEEYQIPSGFT